MSHPEVATHGDLPRQGLAPGDHLGSYRILEPVAEGGMAYVYSARHEKLQREVALKVLKPGFSMRVLEVQRFLEEARAISALRHPRIVEIHDFVESPGSDPPLFYMVMELLRGQTLAARLRAQGPLPLNEAITVGCQVAEALAAVHRAGLLHRDLKASNIFLVESEDPPSVKLLDFGLTVPLGGGHELTDPGKILGTPEYMSPEQIQGQPLDRRSDLYALGVVLYEMLVGDRPFPGQIVGEVLEGHLEKLPPRLRPLRPMPEDLEAVVLRCLEKQPGRRYPDVRALREALASCLTVTSELVPDIVIGPPLRSRRGFHAALGILLAGAAAAVAGLAYFELRSPSPDRAHAGPTPAAPDRRSPADLAPRTAVGAPDLEVRTASRHDAGPLVGDRTTRRGKERRKRPGAKHEASPKGAVTVDPWKL